MTTIRLMTPKGAMVAAISVTDSVLRCSASSMSPASDCTLDRVDGRLQREDEKGGVADDVRTSPG
ncbi:hypothetical protein GGTG_10460 [Gaeumannomyces tritici R3-111a-1]|uniref:Uncharacterized protein n=1 Tax=Gaeumannomyces tritici (strain R3-111a-1) TaxID=644352 RepID=J3PAD4_GAET3|nr:hypothetical protein GGTG_10460 [Gaeumannomyces tritici R3-111a-1]EJT71200.1 hypothetical protein GGTG_10460 [Gaeumannomyces tritici R3-111a-1]